MNKIYPCDGPDGFCPFDAMGGMDCYNLCGLGADNGEEDEYDEEYYPSSTYGDYSPSNPWNAPGMSIRDFI